MLSKIKNWARTLQRDVVAVYYAARDNRTPRYVRALALFIAAYALSPIDLIPDFIPILGYLDDLIIVPIGLWLIIRWLPAEVLLAAREKANTVSVRPTSRRAALIIVGIWIFCLCLLCYWWWRH